ncbi:MAG: AcrB/AcrD/AcrF family protein [Planctomycetota bacterium]|nr:MAG: AcrB/AcrD/AcrF family protein [Planctomycetota bacterium]
MAPPETPAAGKGGLLALGVTRPVGMLMVVLAGVVFGLVSLSKLPVDLLPAIDYPSLTVRTIYEGAAPEDVEERVTDRLEDVLSTVRGLVRMKSSSRAEVSEILMEFEWGSNLPLLVQDVRERLDRVFLPQGVDRPLILRYDPSLDPILRIALSGGDNLVRLRDIAELEIERELEGLPGVAAVKVRGGLEDEIQVRLDPQRLAAFRISGQTVRQRLTEENLNVPGGKLEEGAVEYVVRTLNEFTSLEEIREMPVMVRDEKTIKLRDLAAVEMTHKDRDVILRVAGQEAVEIDIFREAGANIVEVAQAVRDKVFGTAQQQAFWRQEALRRARADQQKAEPEPASAEDESKATKEGDGKSQGRQRQAMAMRQRMGDFIAHQLPSDLKLTLLSDQSEFVRGAIGEVREAGLAGGLLAIMVCFLFLRRLAATFIIGISIPVSIMATFGPMYLSDVTLNVMSLGGLALGIGMLVDNTIVVLESITRCREEGDPPIQAAIRGVREVGTAVTASTLTTIAVFAPIVFVEGLAGQTFGDQSLTVVSSLLISLAVALFFIPGLAARLQFSQQESQSTGQRLKRELAGLFPHLRRPKSFFHGIRWPRRWWLWLILSLVAAAAGSMLSMQGQMLLKGNPDPIDLKEGLKEKAVAMMFAGTVLFLPILWLLGGPLLLILSRLVVDLVGLVSFLLRALLSLPLAALGVILWLPGLLVSGLQNVLEKLYPPFLKAALHAPVVVLALVALLAWQAYQTSTRLGKELLPEVLQGEITAECFFPAGYPLEESDRLARQLEEKIRALEGVKETVVVSGADRETISQEEDGPHTTRITLRLQEGPKARAVEAKVERQLRQLLEREPALARYNLRRPTLLALNAPLEIEVLEDDLQELARVSRQVEGAVRDIPGLVDLRSSVRRGNPEVRITFDREKLAEHGLELAAVANRMRMAVEGEVSSTYPTAEERLDIRVRADFARLRHVEELLELPANPEAERPLPLGAVCSLTIADGPSEIRHIGGRRAAVLTASMDGFDLGGLSEALAERLASVPKSATTTLEVSGQKEEMDKALGSLGFALALAVFLVYAVMAAQFESLVQPFLIMFSVPLAAVGAIFALQASQTPISVVALLGAVVLAGIVVNNAIVLVDRINRNRQNGMGLDQAILEAGRARLRPILMTTVTTVLGMLPLTGWLADVPGLGGIGAAEGTELRAPMALVVITGLISSTLLTLIVIPVGYRLLALLSRQEFQGEHKAS